MSKQQKDGASTRKTAPKEPKKVLTAEGWKRRFMRAQRKPPAKSTP